MTKEESTLKKLPSKASPKKPAVTSADGWRFGLGFWLAWAAISLIVVPAILCTTLFMLSLFAPLIRDALAF